MATGSANMVERINPTLLIMKTKTGNSTAIIAALRRQNESTPGAALDSISANYFIVPAYCSTNVGTIKNIAILLIINNNPILPFCVMYVPLLRRNPSRVSPAAC
jgi:hypothetical protein